MTRASFIRSFLKRGTTVLTSTFLLFTTAWGGESKNTDSFAEAPTQETAQWHTVTYTTQMVKRLQSSTASQTLNTTTTTTTTTSVTTSSTTQSSVSQSTQSVTTTSCTSLVASTSTTGGVEIKQTTSLPITEQEWILVANVVSHEAGSKWIGEYERACIVAAIMNRVKDPRFPNTIDAVLHQPYQFFDVPYYRVDYSGIGYAPIDNAIRAYFSGKYNCGNINSWSGNGRNNSFYYQ